jgi:poly(3-hydroxybutyrate) depolymerase
MVVNGYVREYMVYVPETAKKLWGDKAPVLMVFPGDSQTDKVFLDATQWWQVAQEKGFVLTIVCEQYNNSSVAVSHKDNNIFYPQLREEILKNYDVDPARIYATGQSAGSMASQGFAITNPEFFAAVASTSGASTPSASSSNKMIPVYLGYGAGDLSMLKGDLWDGVINQLDSWAAYHLGINNFEIGNGVDNVVTDGNRDRYKIWTWSKKIGTKDVPLVQVHLSLYRSHNCMSEEMPMLWDFLEHYSYETDENNNVTRYYSESGFKTKGDKVQIYSEASVMQ